MKYNEDEISDFMPYTKNTTVKIWYVKGESIYNWFQLNLINAFESFHY